MNELFEQLEEAKQAVKSCLESDNTLVGMHGLAYWAGRVETLRQQIKERL